MLKKNNFPPEICIITGCSSGLGLEILKKLLKSKKIIYGISKNKKKLNKLKANLKKENILTKNIVLKNLDISKEIKVKKFIKNIISRHKRIDVLINNAGINGPMGEFEKIKTDIWKKAFEVNFYGSFYFYKYVLPNMKKNRYGRIVQISGGGATSPFPMFTPYATAKSAIVRLAETLSKEVKKEHNIKINSIAPGTLNTKFTELKLKAGPKKIGSKHFLLMKKIKKYGGDDPSKAAELCLKLIDKKNKLNGKIISAVWDNWEKFSKIQKKLNDNDVLTIRRISGRDRNLKIIDK